MKVLINAAMLAGLTPFLISNGVEAQEQQPADPEATRIYLGEVARIADTCIGNWESSPCIENISGAAFKLAADHAVSQTKSGHIITGIQVANSCVAASSAKDELKETLHFMRNAFVECLNAVSDAIQATGAGLDLAQYRLVGAAVGCIDKSPACAQTENSLRQLSAGSQPR